jgi:hypothetical protein
MMCDVTSQPSSGAVKVCIGAMELRVIVHVPGMKVSISRSRHW